MIGSLDEPYFLQRHQLGDNGRIRRSLDSRQREESLHEGTPAKYFASVNFVMSLTLVMWDSLQPPRWSAEGVPMAVPDRNQSNAL
ncbi:MAG: hypothetical protein NZM29_08125 [Nitrospira sp.]|nr:hypothetical protein [Nitrospira sp.]MDW8224331.1 hypothetical protein [Gemmatales bacterium]